MPKSFFSTKIRGNLANVHQIGDCKATHDGENNRDYRKENGCRLEAEKWDELFRDDGKHRRKQQDGKGIAANHVDAIRKSCWKMRIQYQDGRNEQKGKHDAFAEIRDGNIGVEVRKTKKQHQCNPRRTEKQDEVSFCLLDDDTYAKEQTALYADKLENARLQDDG